MSDEWQPAPTPQAWLIEHRTDADLDTRAWTFLCAYSGALNDVELADELEEEGDQDPVILRAIEMLRTKWRPDGAWSETTRLERCFVCEREHTEANPVGQVLTPEGIEIMCKECVDEENAIRDRIFGRTPEGA